MDVRKKLGSEAMIELTDKRIANLQAFFGYGGFKQAHMIFLGNEEGLASTNDYELSIRVRTDDDELAFGNDKQYYIDSDKKDAGYWEPGGEITNKKMRDFFQKNGSIFRIEDINSHFLRYMARIVLFLERPKEGDESYWFKPLELDKLRREQINIYIYENILCDRDGICTALMDWRPIPRASEGVSWPYTGPLNEKKYLDAFNFHDNESDSLHCELRDNRLEILKSAFAELKVPIIICTGFGDWNEDKQKYEKQIVLESIIKDKDGAPVFLDSYGNKPKKGDSNKFFRATVNFEGHVKHVFLTPFFGGGKLRLDGLMSLAVELRQILNGSANVKNVVQDKAICENSAKDDLTITQNHQIEYLEKKKMESRRTELNTFIVNELKKQPHLKFNEKSEGNTRIRFVSTKLDLRSPKITLDIFEEIFIFEIINKDGKINLKLFVSGGDQDTNNDIRSKILQDFDDIKKRYNYINYWSKPDYSDKQPGIYNYPLLRSDEYNDGTLTEEMKKKLIERLNDFKGNHLSVIEHEFKLLKE